jgi:hypothetical protein
MIMWNERRHHQEWNRVQQKMLQHRKRLGVRERSDKDGDGSAKKRQESADKSHIKVQDSTAKRCVKRLDSGEDTLAAAHESSIGQPQNKKRSLSELDPGEIAQSATPPVDGRERKISRKSELSAKKSDASEREPTIEKRQSHNTVYFKELEAISLIIDDTKWDGRRDPRGE